MSHAWSTQMGHLARDLGVHGYQSGTLWFREQNGVEVVVEPMLDGESLALHARMGRVGVQASGPTLQDLLRANALPKSRCTTAIDAVDDDVILFRRFDNAALSYESFVAHVQQFALTAGEGLPGLSSPQDPQAEMGMDMAHSPSDHAQAANAVRNAIGDFAHARGLTPPEDASHFLVCMPGGGGISVQLEPSSGDVLLISHLGPVPADEPLLRQLLELHMLGESTGGAYFAIDAQTDDLMLHRRVGADGFDGLLLDRLLNAMGAATVDCAQRLGIVLPRFD